MYTDYNDENDNESYYSDDDNRQQNGEKFKKIIIFVLAFIIVLILILIMAKGCSKKSNNSKTSQVSNVSPTVLIGRETLALDVGESFQNGVDVLNTKNANPVVTWRSDDSSIASVNDEGYITGQSEGKTTINVVYKENNKYYTNHCIVTVTKNVVKLESINLTQNEITLSIGRKFLIELTTSPADAKVNKLIFTSDDSSVATVNDRGVITAVAAGTTRISIKNEDDTISTSMVVVVPKSNTSSSTPKNTEPVKETQTEDTPIIIQPTSIDIAGIENGLTVGKTAKIIWNVLPNNATNKKVTFTSSNTKIATVNSDGVVTGVSAGTCTIIVATSNNITKSIEVKVNSNVISVSGVSIVGSTKISMKVGYTKLLQYKVAPDNATNKGVSFKSSNTSVVFVDSNGIMAAVGPGTAVVTITTKDGGKTAVANVTVTGTNVSGTSSSSSTSLYSQDSDLNYSISSSSTTIYESSSSNTYVESCNAYDMLTITHNEKGEAIVSTISFDNTKPFVKTNQIPTLEVIQTSCVKNLNYYVYYGNTENNINSNYLLSGSNVKTGTKIYLTNGKGYYKIIFKGLTNNNIYLTKTYYAYVKNGVATANNYITISPYEDTSEFIITRNKTNINRIYYCVVGKTSDDCDPSLQISGLNSNKTVYRGYLSISTKPIKKSMIKISSGQPGINKGAKICFMGYNGNILVGDKICRDISDPITVTPTISGKSFVITKTNSSINRVYYCVTGKTSDSCVPNINTGYNKSKTIYYGYVGMTNTTFTKTMTPISSGQPSLSKGAKICFKAYSNGKLIGSNFCRIIK